MNTETQERLKILTASMRTAVKHPHKAESIHKLRVAIRRFTQALRVFRDSFDHPHVRKMRKSLRKIMDLCGEMRNCDIALDVLEAAGVPADKRLRHRLGRVRSHAERDLIKRLSSHAVKDLHHWRKWVAPSSPASEKKSAATEAAPDVLPKLAREFSKAGSAAVKADATYTQMHQFRLLVKRYRYTLEILAAPEHRIEMMRHIQEHLGAINDCVTTSALLDETGVKTAELRPIKTALNRLLERRTAEFRIYWKAHKAAVIVH